jgi:hypothetical protein
MKKSLIIGIALAVVLLSVSAFALAKWQEDNSKDIIQNSTANECGCGCGGSCEGNCVADGCTCTKTATGCGCGAKQQCKGTCGATCGSKGTF